MLEKVFMRAFVTFCLGIITLYASEFTGIGFGDTIKEAKQEALADLSQSIKADVLSKFISYKAASKTSANKYATQNIQVTSNLPILGAEYKLFENPGSVQALVTLSPAKAKSLYLQKLNVLLLEIKEQYSKVKRVKGSSQKAQQLGLLMDLLKEYNRYQSVAIVIGIQTNEIKRPPVSVVDINSELLALEHNIDSLAMAAVVLAKPFQAYKAIYIYPPKVSNSHEITPFAKAVKLQMRSKLKTVFAPSKADYWLVGEYVEDANGVVLNYALLDVNTHQNSAAATCVVPKKAYGKLRTSANSVDFDLLLNEGVVVSNDFKVSVSTNKGSEDILYNAGEEAELFVKLNKMGYFYVVGYTQTSKRKHSYLLELSEAPGNNKFIQFINADDANRWVSLGTFEVAAPFGIESLQIIASNKKPTRLPHTLYDEASGYYVIGESITHVLSKTRGMIRKKSKENAVDTSEAVLSFTTTP